MTKMRRTDRAISREDALAVIDRCAYGTLSLIATDGTPYAVALNVVRDGEVINGESDDARVLGDGEKLFFHSAPEGLKVDSLHENPQVCLLFVENPTIYEKGLTTLYTSSVVRGKVTEITDFDEKRRALRLLCDRFVPGLTKEETGCVETGPKSTGVWCMEIESVTGKQNRRMV